MTEAPLSEDGAVATETPLSGSASWIHLLDPFAAEFGSSEGASAVAAQAAADAVHFGAQGSTVREAGQEASRAYDRAIKEGNSQAVAEVAGKVAGHAVVADNSERLAEAACMLTPTSAAAHFLTRLKLLLKLVWQLKLLVLASMMQFVRGCLGRWR